MNTNNDTILSEIQKAKQGDQTAYSFLLDHFWGYVYHYQLKTINNEEDAEDITIQTFSKAFEKLNLYDEQYEFKTWLITISKRLYIDSLRKRNSHHHINTTTLQEEKAHSIIDEEPSPEQKIILEQNLAKLLRDIKELKPKYREVINLRFLQDLSYKEIATQTNQPINTIKVTLLRAKKLLASIIIKK